MPLNYSVLSAAKMLLVFAEYFLNNKINLYIILNINIHNYLELITFNSI